MRGLYSLFLYILVVFNVWISCFLDIFLVALYHSHFYVLWCFTVAFYPLCFVWLFSISFDEWHLIWLLPAVPRRIQTARVWGSGSICHRWCTGRTSWSAGWRPRSQAQLWLWLPPSCWCPGWPTHNLTTSVRPAPSLPVVAVARVKQREWESWREWPTSSVSSRPLSSYSAKDIDPNRKRA